MESCSSYDCEPEQSEAAGLLPRLLLHCCCAPCASYVLEYLSPKFSISVFYCNPNIEPREEYDKRESELRRLIGAVSYPNPVNILEYDDYSAENAEYKEATKALTAEPEGGRRCEACFEMRLEETAVRARAGGFDCFTTTLSVSPYKNAALLNEIGYRLGQKHGIEYLYADFKKRDGYKRSIELSRQYGLYRQAYCGCMPSFRSSK